MSSQLAVRPLDLTTCDREPIHVPGSIQPHGVLFVLDQNSRTVLQGSLNLPETVRNVLRVGRSLKLADTIGEQNAAALLQDLDKVELSHNPLYLRTIVTAMPATGNTTFHALAHVNVDG